jgi:general stress protein 26
MNMEQVKALMKEVETGFLATTDGQRASVRPMGGWAWMDDELWCATGVPSPKVGDVRACPHVEYCFMKPDGHHVRITGPCTVSTERDDKERLFGAVPVLSHYVEGPDDPGFAVLRLAIESIRWWDGPGKGYEEVTLT